MSLFASCTQYTRHSNSNVKFAFKQDVTAKTKAITAEVTELKKKKQQAEHSLAELKKKSRNVEVKLATEKRVRQGLEAGLIAADKRRQTAEEDLHDLRRTSIEAAKVSYYTASLHVCPSSTCIRKLLPTTLPELLAVADHYCFPFHCSSRLL